MKKFFTLSFLIVTLHCAALGFAQSGGGSGGGGSSGGTTGSGTCDTNNEDCQGCDWDDCGWVVVMVMGLLAGCALICVFVMRWHRAQLWNDVITQESFTSAAEGGAPLGPQRAHGHPEHGEEGVPMIVASESATEGYSTSAVVEGYGVGEMSNSHAMPKTRSGDPVPFPEALTGMRKWSGWYQGKSQFNGGTHEWEAEMSFGAHGRINGYGKDENGSFNVQGLYNAAGKVAFFKKYSKHRVEYRGQLRFHAELGTHTVAGRWHVRTPQLIEDGVFELSPGRLIVQ